MLALSVAYGTQALSVEVPCAKPSSRAALLVYWYKFLHHMSGSDRHKGQVVKAFA